MEYGQKMKQSRDNALVGLYQNTGYHFERRDKKSVILDVSNDSTTTVMSENFNVKLLEPLVIDCLSDVYLDSFTTYNALGTAGASGDKNIGFTLKINEFNNNINVASNQDKSGGYDSTKFNSIFIPNSNHTTNNTFGISHKMRKFNYVASMNPGTISSLSGKILDAGTNLRSAEGVYSYTYASPFTIDIDASEDDNGMLSRFIAEFMIVARD